MKSRIAICVFFIFCSLIFFYTEALGVSINIGGLKLNKKLKSMKEIKSRNVVRQSLDYSCGPAGLATILNYYLRDSVSEKEIIETLLKTTSLAKVKERKGFSLLDLKRFAQTKGYNVTGYKMDIDFLQKLDKPVLVPIKFKNYRHFVVVKAVLGDRIFLADPTAGNMTMKINRFTSIWEDNIGLVIEGSEPKDPLKEPLSYPLKVKMEEAAIVDYRNIKRNLERSVIRTTIFPEEY